MIDYHCDNCGRRIDMGTRRSSPVEVTHTDGSTMIDGECVHLCGRCSRGIIESMKAVVSASKGIPSSIWELILARALSETRHEALQAGDKADGMPEHTCYICDTVFTAEEETACCDNCGKPICADSMCRRYVRAGKYRRLCTPCFREWESSSSTDLDTGLEPREPAVCSRCESEPTKDNPILLCHSCHAPLCRRCLSLVALSTEDVYLCPGCHEAALKGLLDCNPDVDTCYAELQSEHGRTAIYARTECKEYRYRCQVCDVELKDEPDKCEKCRLAICPGCTLRIDGRKLCPTCANKEE